VWHERLDNEVAQLADCISDLLVLVEALTNPLLHLLEGLLNTNQSQLSAALDQLIGLDHQRLQQRKRRC